MGEVFRSLASCSLAARGRGREMEGRRWLHPMAMLLYPELWSCAGLFLFPLSSGS